jgi:hypothetical protein
MKLVKEILKIVNDYVYLAQQIELYKEDDYKEFVDSIKGAIKKDKNVKIKRIKKFICPICGGKILCTKTVVNYINPFTGLSDITHTTAPHKYICSVSNKHVIPDSVVEGIT